MIAELFEPDLLLIKQNGSFNDLADFFIALYNRQEEWEQPYIDQSYLGLYSPDRHSGSLKNRSFPLTGESWTEYQLFIGTAYTIATPVNTGASLFAAGNLSVAQRDQYIALSGTYVRPTVSGVPVTTLTASDGTVLATGLVTPLQWETSYNALLVPYERVHSNPKQLYIKN